MVGVVFIFYNFNVNKNIIITYIIIIITTVLYRTILHLIDIIGT
jgi:hypothetical protein